MPAIKFSGLASGIDSASLIDSIIQARSTTNTIRQNEIDFLNSENDALDEFNTKLAALNDLIDGFRTLNGGGVLKKASSSNSSNVTAVAGANASSSSFDVNITTIAKTANASFNEAYSGGSDFVSTAGSGNLTITVGNPLNPEATINVAVTQNVTTVDQLVSAINNATGASGNVYASLVNVGTTASPSYRVMMSSQKTGLEDGKLTLSADAALTELQSGVTTLDQATDAQFTVDGISGTITRSSNTISDIITGVTFQLQKDSSTATVTVGTDAASTSDAVSQIVSAYNDLVDFINQNNSIDRVESGDNVSNVYGTLAKTNVDDDFISSFQSKLSEASSSIGTIVKSMSELGISTNRDGTLSFDEETFQTNVGADPNGAAQVLQDFADTVAGTSGLIYQYTKFNGYIDLARESNTNEIENLNDAIDTLNRSNDTLRTSLETQFSNLETVVGRLQSQQQSLSAILSGLG